MEIKLLHLYHDIMSLYGDWANVALLRRHLEDLGNTVTVEKSSFGGGADIAGADFLFIGAGTERSQKAVLEDFRQYGEAVIQAARDGRPMLFTGTAFEMLGREITDAAGTRFPGIGLMDFTVTETKQRIVGDVYGPCAFADNTVVGFMNKCSRIAGVETPLLSQCEMGFGNEEEHGPEGLCFQNVLGTHLTGPVLVKNPPLLRALMMAIYRQKAQPVPTEWPAYPYEEQGYEVTLGELRKRMGK